MGPLKVTPANSQTCVSAFVLLTSAFVPDEPLEDEDEVEVVLGVTQRQHSDASHARVLLLRCQR